jgi:hypothetical protein
LTKPVDCGQDQHRGEAEMEESKRRRRIWRWRWFEGSSNCQFLRPYKKQAPACRRPAGGFTYMANNISDAGRNRLGKVLSAASKQQTIMFGGWNNVKGELPAGDDKQRRNTKRYEERSRRQRLGWPVSEFPLRDGLASVARPPLMFCRVLRWAETLVG